MFFLVFILGSSWLLGSSSLRRSPYYTVEKRFLSRSDVRSERNFAWQIQMTSTSIIPIIDISPLVSTGPDLPNSSEVAEVISKIGSACREVGFFYISKHGISIDLQEDLDVVACEYFRLSREEKSAISMDKAGKAWRGSFLIGDEVTSGIVDQKEGLYFGSESEECPNLPLHGNNQWPSGELGQRMQRIVTEYMKQLTSLGTVLITAIAASLGLHPSDFGDQFTSPTTLFRIFHYPPHDPRYGAASQAVGEHTDYGYITILRQDTSGGLQVRGARGEWIDAPPVPNTFVINLGDAIEHNTGGLLRATPHRYSDVLEYLFILS